MRSEHDFLGTREVPDDAYYGIQTLRASENFPITLLRIHPLFIRSMADVKRAAALANMEVGLLEPVLAGAIVQAASEVAEGRFSDHFILNPIQGGAGTSVNMNVNEVIANRALEILGRPRGDYAFLSPNNHVNMSQSTNDVFPTALRLTCLVMADQLVGVLGEAARVFKQKTEEFDQVIKVGRTHLQDAIPIRLGQEFGGYARVIERHQERIALARRHLLSVNMGATAVGTGLNADPEYDRLVIVHLREITGLPVEQSVDMVDATQNVDALVELSGALKGLAVDLGKIANDLRLMASGPRAGLAEIELPRLQPGSSIMPGKVNPVMPETVNQVCFQVIGNDLTVSLAAAAGQFELNVFLPVVTANLLQSLDILHNVLRVFLDKCVVGITANVERCREMVENSIGLVTALSPHLGYELASELAAEALRTGRKVRDICQERGVLSPEVLEHVLSVQEMTEPGISGRSLLPGPRRGEPGPGRCG